jgi:hypothetical protein
MAFFDYYYYHSYYCSDCSAIGTGAEGVAWVVLSLAGEGAAG